MNSRPYLYLSAAVFGLVALLHGARLAAAWPAQLGDLAIPLWVSWLGLALAASLSLWGFRLARAG